MILTAEETAAIVRLHIANTFSLQIECVGDVSFLNSSGEKCLPRVSVFVPTVDGIPKNVPGPYR